MEILRAFVLPLRLHGSPPALRHAEICGAWVLWVVGTLAPWLGLAALVLARRHGGGGPCCTDRRDEPVAEWRINPSLLTLTAHATRILECDPYSRRVWCGGVTSVWSDRIWGVGWDPRHWFWAQVYLQLPALVLVLVLVPVAVGLVAGWLLLHVMPVDGQRRRCRR